MNEYGFFFLGSIIGVLVGILLVIFSNIRDHYDKQIEIEATSNLMYDKGFSEGLDKGRMEVMEEHRLTNILNSADSRYEETKKRMSYMYNLNYDSIDEAIKLINDIAKKEETTFDDAIQILKNASYNIAVKSKVQEGFNSEWVDGKESDNNGDN